MEPFGAGVSESISAAPSCGIEKSCSSPLRGCRRVSPSAIPPFAIQMLPLLSDIALTGIRPGGGTSYSHRRCSAIRAVFGDGILESGMPIFAVPIRRRLLEHRLGPKEAGKIVRDIFHILRAQVRQGIAMVVRSNCTRVFQPSASCSEVAISF